jgi:hypothetical protein
MAHCGLAPNEPADRTGVENIVRAQASAHKQVGAADRGRLGTTMAQDKHPFEALSAIEQNMEKARAWRTSRSVPPTSHPRGPKFARQPKRLPPSQICSDILKV